MSFFAVDELALALAIPFVIIAYGLRHYQKTFPRPEIQVSHLASFLIPHSSWKEHFSQLPQQLKLAAMAFLLAAFIDPRLSFEKNLSSIVPPPSETLATEGIAIYLVLDQSGSMSQKVATWQEGRMAQMPKIELLKKATRDFIQGNPRLGLPGRPNDLIGLVEFARTAHVAVPLTLDRKALLERLENFQIVPDRTQDGTAIGYALFKTLYLIEATRNYAKDLIGKGKPAYEIKNSVLILITDGLQDPHPDDKNSRWRQIDPLEAAQSIKELGVRVYIVNVEPRFNAEQYAPHRRQLQKAAEITGGKLFTLDEKTTLSDIYASINHIEKSSLPIDYAIIENLKKNLSKEELPGLYHTIFLAPYLIALAICCLLTAVLLETTLLRKFP